MGERETDADSSSLHDLAKMCELVHEGLLSVSPEAQTRPTKLPEIFWDKILEMQGRGVKLVLEKRLHASDVDPRRNRLSMPRDQIKAKFLTNEEIRTLDSKEVITVSLIEPCLQVRHGLQLKQVDNRENHFSYLLTKEWTAVMLSSEPNRLKVGDLVQLWSFRANGDLCFCLVSAS